MSVTTGEVAFENLRQHEIYNGQDTGKYTVTVTVDDEEAKKLADAGVKLRTYEGQQQRKFSSKFPINIVDVNDEPFDGSVGRGSKIKVAWKEGMSRPVHGTATYLNAVRVIEAKAGMELDEDF